MIRRIGAALLLLAVATCHASKEQSAPLPEALYARGREAMEQEDYNAAERIAAEGQQRFATQPVWRELFGILEAESAAGRKDFARAQQVLAATPATKAALPAVLRLTTHAGTFDWRHANEAEKELLAADALAARLMPELRPEIAARRSRQLFFLGRWDDAVQSAQDAIRGAKAAKQPAVLAEAHYYSGYIQSNRNDRPRYADAIEHYKLAMCYSRAARMKKFEARSMANLGWVQVESGFFDEALANLLPALALAEQQSMPEYQHVALAQICEVYGRRLEAGKAIPYAHRDLEVARESHNERDLANAYHELGQLELELGHYDLARQWMEEALKHRGEDAEGLLSDHITEARILKETGNPVAALELLGDVIERAKPGSPTRWRAEGVEADLYAKLGSPKAEEMYEQTLATGAEARKAVLGNGESALAFGRNLLGFYDNYIDYLMAQGRKEAALRVAERSRARALREAVGIKSDEIDPVKLAREKKAFLLSYWVGPKRSLLWTVAPDGMRDVAELPGEDKIARDADAYRAELLREHSLETSTLGRSLYTELVAPAKIPPGSRVIIRPDARLNALNFETLIVPTPKPHYWIDDVTISYTPSLHMLAQSPAWRPSRDARALLIGDVPAAGREYPALKLAGAELAGVARHFDPSRCVILSHAAATPAAYTAAQPARYQFIHFAAHANASPTVPLDSAIILASDKHGVWLSGRQIVNTPLHAELVTISSCDSAGGRSYAGEGLVGLAWAFLGAGAHRVVAAQWEVNDVVAPGLMDSMYGAIHDGVEPAEALRQAKLKLVHSGTIRKQPFYWGPFVLYGE